MQSNLASAVRELVSGKLSSCCTCESFAGSERTSLIVVLPLRMHEMYYEWNFDAAEAQLQRALELNPSLTATVYHYAWLMELWQYSDKALPLGDKTAELDPLSPYILFTLAEQYRNAGQYDEAIRIADEALALNPQHAGAISTKGVSIAKQGDFETALALLKPIQNAPAWGAHYGAVLALAGDGSNRRISAAIDRACGPRDCSVRTDHGILRAAATPAGPIAG